MSPCIGIDFGGVIVRQARSHRGDTQVELNDGVEIAHEGVFQAVHECVVASGGAVWIVSKAGSRTEARTREWLRKVEFYERTGMSPANLRFCRSRPDKAPICRDLGITHFIDDKIHVMQILRGIVPHLFLFGAECRRGECPPWATPVPRWCDLPRLARLGPLRS